MRYDGLHHSRQRKPRISGQRISHPIANAMSRAREIAFVILVSFQRGLLVSRLQPRGDLKIGALHVAACSAVSLSELTRRGRGHLPYLSRFSSPIVGVACVPHHRSSRGPSAAPARVHTTIVPPYQTATKGNESSVQ